MANIKVKTNIPEIMTFKFNTWKRWENEGTNGKYITYSIGVENRGVDAYFSVYEREYNNIFSKLGNLQDRTLTIEKYEDGKYKNWRILENGQDITPKFNAGQSKNPSTTSDTTEQPNTPHSSISSPTSDLAKLEEKIRLAFKTRDEKIDFLMTENKILSEKVEGLIGVLTEEQLTAYEFHKGGNGKMGDLGGAVEVPEEFLK